MSPIRLRQLVVQSLIAIATIATASAYCSAQLIYQADFEQPFFTPGLLDGQDEWFVTSGWDAATITDVHPHSGAQFLRFDGAALVGGGLFVNSFGQRWLNIDPVVNNFPIINIRADVRLDAPRADEDLISANLTARALPFRTINSTFPNSEAAERSRGLVSRFPHTLAFDKITYERTKP